MPGRAKFVLRDRNTSFTRVFDAVFQAAEIRVIRSAVQAPRMNSITRRWIGNCYGITDLDHFRVRRHDRVGGVIHEYRLVA